MADDLNEISQKPHLFCLGRLGSSVGGALPLPQGLEQGVLRIPTSWVASRLWDSGGEAVEKAQLLGLS